MEYRQVIDEEANQYGRWIIADANIPSDSTDRSFILPRHTYEFRVNATALGQVEPLVVVQFKLGPGKD